MTKKMPALVSAAFACTVMILLAPSTVRAGYPMVSAMANQHIDMSSQTDAIPFTVTDDETPAEQLVVSYRSSNKALVPEDDYHIAFGGNGSYRTVQVTPVPGAWGQTTITIIVTDGDGDKNRDYFTVDVDRPPR